MYVYTFYYTLRIRDLDRKVSIARHSFFLTSTDRLLYVYKYRHIQDKRDIKEVTSVSYLAYIGKRWEMVVYYDNDASHNYVLHRHTRISLESYDTIITYPDTREESTSREYLTWCINDIKANYMLYKKNFLRRKNV